MIKVAESPEVLNNFRVGGRLVAMPTFIDMGVLYYRSDLLRKYGYTKPPATWEQLQEMSRRIQAGERKIGRRNFWGYVWQGGAYEALTCNALEWQASQGGGSFLGEENYMRVNNPEMLLILKRAVSWIGKISPPGEAYYREMDAMNFWNEGNAAFMRSWSALMDWLTSIVGRTEPTSSSRLSPAAPEGSVARWEAWVWVSRNTPATKRSLFKHCAA